MRAIQITRFGGPEVLDLVDLDEPVAGDGHALVRVTRAGVNYADTHQSEDTYLAPQTLPLIPGAEVAGIDHAGQRVVALLDGGGYAEAVAAPLAATFPVPDELGDDEAVALLLQGVTAWHLIHTSAAGVRGQRVVVHAAAGGVGTIAVQLARLAGAAQVIAVASSEAKRDLAVELGADATVDAGTDDLKAALEEAGGGKVDVVLEMAGGSTLDASLAALAPFGRLVTFGMASRTPPSPIDPGQLLARSRGVIGFWLAHCFRDPQRLIAEPLAELYALAAEGQLRPVIGTTYPLAEAAQAHRDIRSRATTGKLLIDPTS